jgi:archaellum component FlaC
LRQIYTDLYTEQKYGGREYIEQTIERIKKKIEDLERQVEHINRRLNDKNV